MTQEFSPIDRYFDFAESIEDYQFATAEEKSILRLNNIQADKDKYLAQMRYKVDPELRRKIGTPEFFREAVDIVWGCHRTRLREWEARSGEGKTKLFLDMTVESDEKRVPTLDEVVDWADKIALPTYELDHILTAAGYDFFDKNSASNPSLRRREQETFIGGMRELLSNENKPGIGAHVGIYWALIKDSLGRRFRKRG